MINFIILYVITYAFILLLFFQFIQNNERVDFNKENNWVWIVGAVIVYAIEIFAFHFVVCSIIQIDDGGTNQCECETLDETKKIFTMTAPIQRRLYFICRFSFLSYITLNFFFIFYSLVQRKNGFSLLFL